MDTNFTALSLVILIVLASGCTGGNGESGKESDKSVEIHSLSVTPNEIYSGTPVNAELEIENTGDLTATLDTGSKGSKILTDRCPDVFGLDKDDFNAAPAEYRVGQNKYKLKPDQGLTFRWKLQQEGKVPLYGKKCNMKFEVPFSYQATAYEQLQIKEDRNIQGSQLNWESSSGPLTLAIQGTGGTGSEGSDTYIAGEDKEMNILVQFQNPQKEKFNKGVTDLKEESLWIAMEDSKGNLIFNETFVKKQDVEDCELKVGDLQCFREADVYYQWKNAQDPGKFSSKKVCELNTGQPLRMLEGESRPIPCNIDLTEIEYDSPSEIFEVKSSVKYDYIKTAGTKRVEVQTRG